MIVALATSEAWPHLHPDDAGLLAELLKLRVSAVPAVWSDETVDWKDFDAVVIRSCWDYHLRPAEFRAWIDGLRVPVFNSAEILRWNMHKSYLLDLQMRGIRIPRTQILHPGGSADFAGSVIIKPAISASAHETHRFDKAREAALTVDRLLRRGDVIIQEFVPEIVADGEWSLVFFNRAFSHGVKKAPQHGDFRVQQELGGSADLGEPSTRLIEAAQKILAAVEGDVLYARVDVVDRPAGVTLMELELIEPMLFLSLAEGSARKFAEAIAGSE